MFLLVFSVSSVFLSPGLCQECEGESWLLPGSSPPLNPDCPYDGSLVPDCQHFLTDLTEYYHVHQHGKREGENPHDRRCQHHPVQTAVSTGSALPPEPVCRPVLLVLLGPVGKVGPSASTAGTSRPWDLSVPGQTL